MMSKCRLNLAINQSVKDQIESLKDEIEADSLTEVIQRAVVVFDLLIEVQKQGHRIEINRHGKIVELILS